MFVYYHNTYSLPLLTIIMRDTTFLRILTDDEKNILHLLLEDKENEYRAKIILLKDQRYAVSQIREITNHNEYNVSKMDTSIL